MKGHADIHCFEKKEKKTTEHQRSCTEINEQRPRGAAVKRDTSENINDVRKVLLWIMMDLDFMLLY